MIHRSSWRPSLSKSLGLARASSRCDGTTCDPSAALLGPRTCLTLWYPGTAVGSEHVIRIYEFQITTVLQGRCQEPATLSCVHSGRRPQQFRISAADVPGDRREKQKNVPGGGGDRRVLGKQRPRITSAHHRSFSGGRFSG